MRTLPLPRSCGRLLVSLAPAHTAMFRFLLEAYGHVACFSVLEAKTALLKVSFSPHREREARRVLAEIAQTVPLTVQEWPCSQQRTFIQGSVAGPVPCHLHADSSCACTDKAESQLVKI